jgi:CheY-like chemotaxis protein
MASILVVDDDADVLATIRAIVASAGHAVATARNGVEALNLLDGNERFDLMLTDIIMPGLNGFNLARMARLRRASMRILYLTGFTEQVTALRDTGERYGKLLNKPILPQELRQEIAAALSGAPPAGALA